MEKKKLVLSNGNEISELDHVLVAIGRTANTEKLNLESVGVKVDQQGHVIVDEFQNTTSPFIYALGDVCGKALLTPVAIAASRKLSDRIFLVELKMQKLVMKTFQPLFLVIHQLELLV